MSAPTILHRIAEERRADISKARAQVSLEELREAALQVPAPGGRFKAGLRSEHLEVIAEVKRASPSKGPISDIPSPVELAQAYGRGGAAGISVLTEPRHFLGGPDDLRAVAQASGVPVLRKDFLIDPYMVWEARLWGASACLLIVALLSDRNTLLPMLEEARAAGLDVLVETHDADELAVAVDAGAEIIGVNHRNLHTFEMDMGLFERLRASIPTDSIAVAESGIFDRATAQRMRDAGADAILVGEHLARSTDPAAAVRDLRGFSE